MKPRNFSHILTTSAFLLTLVFTAQSHAHQIYLWAQTSGQTVEGYAYTPAGRLAGATIIITDADNQTVATLTTDADGQFTYAAHSLDTLTLTLDTGDGHRATKTLTFHTAQPPASYYASEPDDHDHPAATPATQSLDRRLTEISQQLDQLKNQRRWQDIIGAGGYLVGIAGIAFYFLAKKAHANPS